MWLSMDLRKIFNMFQVYTTCVLYNVRQEHTKCKLKESRDISESKMTFDYRDVSRSGSKSGCIAMFFLNRNLTVPNTSIKFRKHFY